MDATEHDLDARLYKASGDLIPELQAKLPLLIWHDGNERGRPRTHVPYAKAAELSRIVSAGESNSIETKLTRLSSIASKNGLNCSTHALLP